MDGYCGTCHYLVDLSEEGRLLCHGRRPVFINGAQHGMTDPCSGTGAFPAPHPGAEDPAMTFTTDKRTGRCPVCESPDAVQTERNGRAYMQWHHTPEADSVVCPGTWEPIEYV